ncbi:MAG: hypothetical protein K0R14_2191 [Burkholderiales bacterium]|nr:hypothetical protein [Burkholderiales bacterium]
MTINNRQSSDRQSNENTCNTPASSAKYCSDKAKRDIEAMNSEKQRQIANQGGTSNKSGSSFNISSERGGGRSNAENKPGQNS